MPSTSTSQGGPATHGTTPSCSSYGLPPAHRVGAVTPFPPQRNGGATMFASQMLLASKRGGTWRQADYRAWLAQSGFEEVTFQPTPSPATLIFAR
jgi:hypothetical protein